MDPPSGTGLCRAALGPPAVQSSLQPLCGLFLFCIFLQCLPSCSCLGCFWTLPPPSHVDLGSFYLLFLPLLGGACSPERFLAKAHTPRWKQLPCRGVPCRVRIRGCLVPEPEPVRASRARLSAVACAQVPGLRGTCTTSTAVLVGKRPGLFNLRGFQGAGQGSLST